MSSSVLTPRSKAAGVRRPLLGSNPTQPRHTSQTDLRRSLLGDARALVPAGLENWEVHWSGRRSFDGLWGIGRLNLLFLFRLFCLVALLRHSSLVGATKLLLMATKQWKCVRV